MDEKNGKQTKQTTLFKPVDYIQAFVMVCNVEGPLTEGDIYGN